MKSTELLSVVAALAFFLVSCDSPKEAQDPSVPGGATPPATGGTEPAGAAATGAAAGTAAADAAAKKAAEEAAAKAAAAKLAEENAKQGAAAAAAAAAGTAGNALDAVDTYIAENPVDTSNPRWKTSLSEPPPFPFDKTKKYYWNITTNKGDIKVLLMPEVAPMHVGSTIYLTKIGFYDNLKFHRVIPGFMAQGGCPLGTGTGGPGYKYAGEFRQDVRHDRPGILSMANAGPGTDGSQFFLTFVPTPHLNGRHTVFGEIVEGMDTMKALEQAGSRSGRTTETLMMEKSTITVE